MPNLDNTLWAKNIRMRERRLEQQRAEQQQAHLIAQQGAAQIQSTLQRGFDQGLKAAQQAGKAAAQTGRPVPQYQNPQMQAQAMAGASDIQYANALRQRAELIGQAKVESQFAHERGMHEAREKGLTGRQELAQQFQEKMQGERAALEKALATMKRSAPKQVHPLQEELWRAQIAGADVKMRGEVLKQVPEGLLGAMTLEQLKEDYPQRYQYLLDTAAHLKKSPEETLEIIRQYEASRGDDDEINSLAERAGL